MLDSAIQFDELTNWSIYQESDGKYTFKIKFSPGKVSHIDSPERTPTRGTHMKSFKLKSDKQQQRDNNRSLQRRRQQPKRTCNEVLREPENCDIGHSSPIVSPVAVELPVSPDDNDICKHNSFCLNADANEFQPCAVAVPLDNVPVPYNVPSDNELEDIPQSATNIKARIKAETDCAAVALSRLESQRFKLLSDLKMRPSHPPT